MGWVTFTQKASDNKSTQSVSFNTDNISAISACNTSTAPNTPRTLIEVVSGKDFWVLEEHAVVMQTITAGNGGRHG